MAAKRTYSDFIGAFKKDYDLQDDGYQRCTEFTGMRLTWHPDGSLAISQPGCVSSILHKYGHWDCRPAFIPALANTPIKLSDCPADGPDGDADRAFMKDKPYREAIGDLLWIARVFRFDIQYAVNACSRVAHKPGPAHWHAVCHILRYLNHTRDYQLIYAKPTEPDDHTIGFTDSDYAPAYGTEFDNYRSTSGNIISHNRHALMWKSRRQDRAAQSSTEAEYYAAASAAKDLLYTSQLMKSLAPHRDLLDTPELRADNKSAIACAQNAQDNDKQRHIDVRAHFLRDNIRRGELNISYVPGVENPADAQTKPLAEAKFTQYRDFHNLRAPYHMTGG